MAMLLTGIAVWVVAHSFPAVVPGKRAALQEKLGEQAYRGIFSLIILGSLLLIVFGWKSAVPSVVYVPPLGPGILVSILVQIGLILFFASRMNGHLKRVLRHPQMIATVFWASAHLLCNGDNRSVALFGAFGVWALFEIVMINRREGPQKEAAAASAKFDLIAVVVGGVVFTIIAYFHQSLFGVAAIPH